MTSLRSLFIFVFAALTLTACKPNLELALASEAELVPAPRFVVGGVDDVGPLDYTTVKLLNAHGEVVWHLRAQDFSRVIARPEIITYGERLEGFDTVIEAVPLFYDAEYTLLVIGVGHGQLGFTVDADGVLTPRTIKK